MKNRISDNKITLLMLLIAVITIYLADKNFHYILELNALGLYVEKKFMPIPLKYDYAKSFKCGLAPVKTNNKWGFIDKSDKFVIQPQFDGAKTFREDIAAVKIGNKWGFINKSGKIVIKPIYDDVLYYNNGVAPVRTDKIWDLIDRKGKSVKKVLNSPEYFNENDVFGQYRDYHCNPIDKWHVIFYFVRFNDVEEYIDHSYLDEVNSKCKNTNKLEGFYARSKLKTKEYRGYSEINGGYYEGYGYSEGYDLLVHGGGYVNDDNKDWYNTSGFIDKNKRWVVPPIFEDAEDFSEGYAAVKLNGKWGYISKERLEKYKQK